METLNGADKLPGQVDKCFINAEEKKYTEYLKFLKDFDFKYRQTPNLPIYQIILNLVGGDKYVAGECFNSMLVYGHLIFSDSGAIIYISE